MTHTVCIWFCDLHGRSNCSTLRAVNPTALGISQCLAIVSSLRKWTFWERQPKQLHNLNLGWPKQSPMDVYKSILGWHPRAHYQSFPSPLIPSSTSISLVKTASVHRDVIWGTYNMPQLFLLSHARLATWLDHYRSLQLQDGAFMAMLLDSYVVEVGQPWWLHLDIPCTSKEAMEQMRRHWGLQYSKNGLKKGQLTLILYDSICIYIYI